MTEKNIKVEFPIEIGIIGPPGSGKAKLIKEFTKISGDWFEKNGNPLKLIPNVGTDIEKSYDQAMGSFGAYRDNLWGFFKRFSQEKACRKKNQSYISNGTMLDSLAHAGVRLESVILGLQGGLITPESQLEVQKEQMAMDLMTVLFLDNLQYKFAYRLPLPEKIVVPGEDESDDRYARRIGVAIDAISANWGVYPPILDQPTIEEKAQWMFDNVVTIMREGVTIKTEDPEPVAQTDSEDPEEFSAVVSEVVDGFTPAPCSTCVQD